MYTTQPRSQWPRTSNRPSINTPCQLSMGEQDISMSPYSLTKSIKLKQKRLRPSFTRKSKASMGKNSNSQLVKKTDNQLDAHLNICRFFKDSVPTEIIKNYTPRLSEYETTADRMFNLRKRLSPVKRSKQEKRFVNSVDAARENPVQRKSFLNIQKLELIRIYSQSQKQTDTTKGEESMEQRYSLSPSKQSRQLIRKVQQLKDEDFFGNSVLQLKKTLKEANASKWNHSKSRSRPFIAPFDRYYYKDFIWKVAFSNGLLLNPVPEDLKLKVYVGKGNNSQLVRSLIRRRNWWTFTQRWEQANLVWTQLKINGFFALQESVIHNQALSQPLTQTATARNELNLWIMNESDVGIWDSYWRQNRGIEQKLGEDMSKRNAYFKKLNLNLSQINPRVLRMQNHMSQNFVIGNKKALLYTMRQYYESIKQNVFDYLPLSFHITQGFDDHEYSRFLGYFYEKKKKAKKDGNNIWIVKPGELTNRGNGIIVCLTLEEVKAIIKRGGKHFDGTTKTFIFQEYIDRPLLYQRRKFDIRHYILVTSINGRYKGYWFKRGYIRTSSSEYTLNHGQASVHLTNDAVQKNMPDYGRYQKGNKVSYEDFQTYLLKEYAGKFNFFRQIYPQMKKIATDTIRASARTLNPKNLQQNFQIFGLDFMIDGDFHPWLIECNSNPCLQISCPLLASIIPALIENTLKICMDSLAAPPADFSQKRPRFTDNVLSNNEFQLVYDSVLQERGLQGSETFCSSLNVAELDKEEDEEFQDDGEVLED